MPLKVDFKHPSYAKFVGKWARCRDAVEGLDAVLGPNRANYVPMLDGQDPIAYGAYISKGNFFGATGRTVQGLNGALHFKEMTWDLKAATEWAGDVGLNGVKLETFARDVTEELLSVGRYGILTDFSEMEDRPYWAGYTAENIINWQVSRIDGVMKTTLIVLQEQSQAVDEDDLFVTQSEPRIRALGLVNGIYVQQVYRKDPKTKEWVEEGGLITPMRGGDTLDEIPFAWFGSTRS